MAGRETCVIRRKGKIIFKEKFILERIFPSSLSFKDKQEDKEKIFLNKNCPQRLLIFCMLFIYFFYGIDAARSFVKKEKKKKMFSTTRKKREVLKDTLKKVEFYKTCASRRIINIIYRCKFFSRIFNKIALLIKYAKRYYDIQRLIHYVKQIPEEYCIKCELRMPH